jgi:hypothetical protein
LGVSSPSIHAFLSSYPQILELLINLSKKKLKFF